MPKKVLIADDDKSFRNILKMIVAKAGYEVVAAEDGRQAYDAACAGKPDLIISDVTMPEMGGYEFLEQVRGNDELKDTPFLLITGHAAEDRPGLRVDGYVSKPPSKSDLLGSISGLIGEA